MRAGGCFEGPLSADRIDALRQAIAAAPDNTGLRLLLAEMLSDAGRLEEAADEYDSLFDSGLLPDDALLAAGTVAAQLGRQGRASTYADLAATAGIEGVAELRAKIDASLGLDGTLRLVRRGPEDEGDAPLIELESDPRVTFGDIGGLEEVKKAMHRTIILPFQRPELYELRAACRWRHPAVRPSGVRARRCSHARPPVSAGCRS